jgi:hypothetical protein
MQAVESRNGCAYRRLVGGKLVVVRAVIWFDCSVLQRADEGWRIDPRSYAACSYRIAGVVIADAFVGPADAPV